MPHQFEFPVEYATELDQVLMHETYAGRYAVQGAEFVSARQVKVPTLDILTTTVADYSRFTSANVDSKLSYEVYELGNEFDYQSECHCSKTPCRTCRARPRFDYQSECHCSKTKRG